MVLCLGAAKGWCWDRFRAAASVFITAQEILVDRASYPTPLIAKNSHLYRPLGLGYANLGSLLMSMGIPYDSNAGRGIAGSLTALLTAAVIMSLFLLGSSLVTATLIDPEALIEPQD